MTVVTMKVMVIVAMMWMMVVIIAIAVKCFRTAVRIIMRPVLLVMMLVQTMGRR